MSKKQVGVYVFTKDDEDWALLAADSFVRLKKANGYNVNFFGPTNEFTQLFKVSINPPEFKPSNNAIKYLISRLQQSGAAYKRRTLCYACTNCGLPSHEKVVNCSCGGAVVRTERDGYFLRVKQFSEEMVNLISRPNLVLPRYQFSDLTSRLGGKGTEDILVALGTTRDTQELHPESWFGTFISILSKCGFPGDEGSFQRLWPETYVFVSKELNEMVLHWIAVLAALKMSGPGGLICHSPLSLFDKGGQKVGPLLLAKNYGHESVRYFTFGVKFTTGENSFSEEQVIQNINHDLANELGNLVSRVVALVLRLADGLIPQPDVMTRQTADLELRESALDLPLKMTAAIEGQELHQAVRAVKAFVGTTNKFIELTAPWQNSSQPARLNTVLYNLCEALRFLAVSLKPLLPEAALNILHQIGVGEMGISRWSALNQWGLIPVGTRVLEQPPLFPRIIPGYGGIGPEPDLILREELSRIRMIVVRIVSAEPIAEFESMLQLILYDGRQRRRVVAPIAHSAKPEQLSGKKVVMVSNLRPVEVDGIYSEGEVLVSGAESGNLQLIIVDDDIPEGSSVLCLT